MAFEKHLCSHLTAGAGSLLWLRRIANISYHITLFLDFKNPRFLILLAVKEDFQNKITANCPTNSEYVAEGILSDEQERQQMVNKLLCISNYESL